jgi:hypothetical protein
METCHDCYEEFNTWVELAQHIISQKKTHNRKSRVWALKFLSKKDNVKEHKSRMPMSPELRQAVKECVREISGETKKGLVKCPQCRKKYDAEIEIEYLQDLNWRDDEGCLVVMCKDCRSSYRKN